MSDLSKATFAAILRHIVTGFEDTGFQEAFAAAKAAGDVSRMVALPTDVQTDAFAAHGLDPIAGQTAFKAAGRLYAEDADVAALLGRMKAAL